MDAADDITKFAVAESIARQKQRGTNRTIPYRLDEVSTGAPRGASLSVQTTVDDFNGAGDGRQGGRAVPNFVTVWKQSSASVPAGRWHGHREIPFSLLFLRQA